MFIYLDLFFTNCFCFTLLDLLAEMAENSQPVVNTMNSHLLRIDVVKFDSMNNFDMWRCEVMDALTVSNLENSLLLEEETEETSENDMDKMNRMACGIVRSYLI